MADDLEQIKIKKAEWSSRLGEAEKKRPPRNASFTTHSDMDVPLLSTPDDLASSGFNYLDDLGFPGEFPYTRGVQHNMYRGKFWTMRQFAGFAGPKETNKRFKLLLDQGQTGLSTAFDMPALMGRDADHPFSKGEVGKCGVAVSSLEDMEELYSGIPLDKVTTSMTINAPAIVFLMMYFAVAEKQGVPKNMVRGTIQNDILKEYIAQKEWIVPVKPAVDFVTDTIEYCTKHYSGWNSVSISGYHIREAGATAVQELAFTLADGLAYVDEAIKRGLSVDEFAPRLSFFFDVHNDFFEEIAKFRAARRLWARIMKDRYGAQNPKSLMLRTHAQTAGVSLTAQQPINNVVRVALQAMSGVLGGTNSLHTNALDETLALPTDETATIALRTQQIIAEESGVANVADPLAGSYFVESLTNRIEKEALDYIKKIDEMGGMIKAVENGYPQSEIADSAYQYQLLIDSGKKNIVGVTKYKKEAEEKIETLYIDLSIEKNQIEKLQALRSKRSSKDVQTSLEQLKSAAQAGGQNLCDPVLGAVKSYATLGEICDVFRGVYGEYRETGVF